MMIKPEFFDEYTQWLRTQGKAESTIREYVYVLKRIPDEVADYFANPNLKGKNMQFAAYRSYLKFLCKKKKLITRADLVDYLDMFKEPRRNRNHHSDRKWSVPKSEWGNCIRKIPQRVGKMGVWIGFNFGLRRGEILHLRIQDINFDVQEIIIRPHEKTAKQEYWTPKYNRTRQIPFTKAQAETLKKWINERPKDLGHNYLLWTPLGPREGLPLQPRCFHNYCKKAGIHAHVLRYSFATHWYNQSKDVKLISDLLGHSNVSVTSEYLQFGKRETMSKARQLFAQA